MVKQLPQSLSLLGTLEGLFGNGMWALGALLKRLGQPLLVEGVDGVTRGLWGLQPKERAIW